MSVIDRFVAAVTPPESEEDRARAREKARAAAGAGDWLDQNLPHHQQIEMAFSEAEAAMEASSRTRPPRKPAELLTAHSRPEEAAISPPLSTDHKTQQG